MLDELCKELKNWFDRDQPKLFDVFDIVNGKITNAGFTDVIRPNQYFRISGSIFNDGVHQYTDSALLIDEEFTGIISLMAVPKQVLDLNNEIDAWIEKYSDAVNSPYASESFGGYSYSKVSESSKSSVPTWQGVFASKLKNWRKI